MTSRLVSAFECIIENSVEPLCNNDKAEGYRILMEDSFNDFLNFLEEKGSITEFAHGFLAYDLYLYEVNEKGYYLNYYEEDFDKRNRLIDRVFGGEVDKYAELYKELN